MAVNSAIGVTLEQQSAQKKYGEAGVRLFKSFYVGIYEWHVKKCNN